jgi:hypothetical protein
LVGVTNPRVGGVLSGECREEDHGEEDNSAC